MTERTSTTRILIVDDEPVVRESLASWLERDGHRVATAGSGPSALARVRESEWSIVLIDLQMPGVDGLGLVAEVGELRPGSAVVVMTVHAAVEMGVAAVKQGAFDFLVKPFGPDELSLAIARVESWLSLERENRLLRRALKREFRFRDVATRSPAMQVALDLARTAARSASSLLMLGESGSGKEMLARAIHAESRRSEGPFVTVSCAALSEPLLEAEILGYEKGAIPGAAARRRGRLEAAAGGTLFLDEVGSIGPKLQLDLLRVIEERSFSRVGGLESIPADARIVAATNRDLQRAVQAGSFREDLYYRLSVIPIRVPPLRERREDIPLLVEQWLERLSAEHDRDVDGATPGAMERLTAHAWPGNVRELRNVLERAMVVAPGRLLRADDLGLKSRTEPEQEARSLAEVERLHVARTLAAAKGNVSAAARRLGIDRSTLYHKMRVYHLSRRGEPQPVLETPASVAQGAASRGGRV